MKTAEEILADAAALVERPGGWCQGDSEDGRGGICMESAIGVAATGKIRWNETARIAVDAVRKEIDVEFLWRWNDERGRTAEEVATALRNAKRHLA